MDLDAILGQFGEKSKSEAKTFDVDAILSEFGSGAKPEPLPEGIKKVIVNTNPAPPISGPDYPTTIEQTGSPSLPVEQPWLTSPSAYEQQNAGKALFSSGVEDIGSGHPYKGIGKAALGGLQFVGAPMSGIVEDVIGKPGNKISPGLGDKASLLVGAALPIAPGANAVIKALPKNKALSTLIENIGKENLPSVVKQMKENPRLAPADLSPKVLQDTQHLFANDGPQINYLKNTSDARMVSRKEAITDAYDTSSGVSVDLAKKIDDLAKQSKKVGNEKIDPAIKGAGPVDVTNTIEAIDKVLKPGVTSVISGESSLPLTAVKKELVQIKAMLGNDKEMRTSAADLHKFQSGLRRTAEGLKSSASGADREMGNALMNIRTSLVSDIDKASGGKYKPALSSYRDEMHIADAFKQGHDNIFSSSKKMENDPSFTKKWFGELTNNEQQAAKEGARAAIYTEMGVAKNPALAGESVARSDFNKAKMEILFGKEETEKLLTKLEHERAIANTHNKVIEGSQTAMRSASKSQFAMPTPTEVGKTMLPVAIMEGSNILAGGVGGVGTALYAGARGANAAKDKIKMELARAHNAQYAKYALPTEGPDREALIKALEAAIPGPKQSLLRRGATGLSRLIGP